MTGPWSHFPLACVCPIISTMQELSVNNFVNKFSLIKHGARLISAACVIKQTNEKYAKRYPLEIFFNEEAFAPPDR